MVVYKYKQTRKQRSRILFNMAAMCWIYVLGYWAYLHFSEEAANDQFHLIVHLAFPIASVILFCIGWWMRSHDATYTAIVTDQAIIVNYPNVPNWSFSIPLTDIKRFESRSSLGPGGQSVTMPGILTTSGIFHEISMNYGNSVIDLFKAVQQVRPDVEFPSRVNMRVAGGFGLDKPYRD